jgi:peptidoglycan hydrolase CwlO-like protein
MKKKLAVFLMQFDVEIVLEESDHRDQYTRLSEFVEVEFTELPKETVLSNQVSALDAQIADIQTKAIKDIDRLNQKKAELLALTHETGHEHI